MRVEVVCDNKTEFDEIVKQLIDEGVNYQTHVTERRTVWISGDDWPDKEHGDTVAYEYMVLFWYDGKLI